MDPRRDHAVEKALNRPVMGETSRKVGDADEEGWPRPKTGAPAGSRSGLDRINGSFRFLSAFICVPFKKLGSAPAPGAAADALVRRRERASASRHPCFFLHQHPVGVPALRLKWIHGTLWFSSTLYATSFECRTPQPEWGARPPRAQFSAPSRKTPSELNNPPLCVAPYVQTAGREGGRAPRLRSSG